MEVQEVEIEGYTGLYTVSSDGIVYSWRTGEKIALKSNPKGEGGSLYKMISLHKDGKQVGRYIHRLVAIAFIPNPENKLTVNHIDGNKLNNSVENLEWATLRENAQHAHKTGLCDGYKITQEDRDERTLELIYSQLPRGKYKYYREMVSYEVLSREGVPVKILDIRNPNYLPLSVFWQYLKTMCEDFMSDMTYKELEVKYNLTKSGVSRIRNKNRSLEMWECYDQWIDQQ